MLFSVRGRAVESVHGRVVLAAVQLCAIAWFSPGIGLPLDDAWIHQVVARTFADTGTLGFAPGQHGAAATSYLWAALLAVNFKVAHIEPSRWALGLNTIAAIGAGQFLYTITDRARPTEIAEQPWRVTALIASGIACISPNMLWFVCSGMEAMPLVALSLGAIAASTSPNRPDRKALAAGVAVGLLALLRPEAAPLGAILVAESFYRTRSVKRAAVMTAPWLACLALYIGSNILKTGHALPSTLTGRRWLWFEMSSGLGRMDRALDFLDAWNLRLGSYTIDTSGLVVWILLAIAMYGALRIARGQQGGARVLVVWALFHASFYALLLPTPGHGGRYQPLTPLLFALCLPLGSVLLLRELGRLAGVPENARFGWFALLGIAPWVALGVPTAMALRNANALAVAHIDNTENAAGVFINSLPPGNVASFDIGRQGFVARRRILDLGGLSDPAVGSMLETGRASTWLADNDVRYVVLPEGYENVLPEFEDYQWRLHFHGNDAIALLPLRSFETPFEKWLPAIKATWNAAPKQVVFVVDYPRKPGPRVVPLVDASAHHEIRDPSGMLARRDKAIAEHELATMDAWSMPFALAPAQARTNSLDDARCTIAFGSWGFLVSPACPEPAVLQATLFEQAGRYTTVGDLGGAARAIPHLVAEVKRRTDPTFHPPLAPLVPPLAGGVVDPPWSAGRFGLPLFAFVLAIVTALDLAAKRGYRLRAPVALALLLTSCATEKPDVGDAMRRGRGAAENALAAGGDANHSRRGPPLMNAARSGDAELCASLLLHGATLDAKDPDGAGALIVATRGTHLGAMAVLITEMQAKGKSFDEQAGARKRTALDDATSIGSVEAVTLLLAAKADPNVKDAYGETALHLLATVDAARAELIARALLDHHADPTITDARGFTPLHAAAMLDNLGMARALGWRQPALMKLTTLAGETPLDVALRYRKDRVAELFIQGGADIGNGTPPLHEAARMDAVERIGVLLSLGADVDRVWHDQTALDVAKEAKSARAAALLRERDR